MLFHALKKQFLHSQYKTGCSGEVEKSRMTVLMQNSGCCFTSCCKWITTIYSLGYYSKIVLISGTLSTSGCNLWQFSCHCMGGWVTSAKSGRTIANIWKSSRTQVQLPAWPYPKMLWGNIFLHKCTFQTLEVTGKEKIWDSYWHKQGKINNNHEQSCQVCTYPYGKRHSLSALQERVPGIWMILVENLENWKNNLGHILPTKLYEVLWDTEMSERIPGQIPPWLLSNAANFTDNSCTPLAPTEHLLNNFKYIIIPLPFRYLTNTQVLLEQSP